MRRVMVALHPNRRFLPFATLPARAMLLAGLLFACCGAKSSQGAQVRTPIDTVAGVHDLPANEAEKALPIHLIATVTYYDAWRGLMFIEDKTGFVYVHTTHDYKLKRGDLVEIWGKTEKSFRTVIGGKPTMRVISHGELSRPAVLGAKGFAQMMGGELDCKQATVEGIVRSALINPATPDRLDIELLVFGGITQVRVQARQNLDPASLIDSQLRVTGVVGGLYNAKWQLMSPVFYVTDASDLQVVRAADRKSSDVPLTAVAGLMETRSLIDNTQRVRVRGIVTLYRPGRSVVIEQAESSISAVTTQRLNLPLGSVVDVTGFVSDGEFGPILKEAMILPTGRIEPVKPTLVSFADAIKGAYNDELVSIRGTVLSQTHTDSSDSLTLLIEHHTISIDMQQPTDGAWLPTLLPGTEVEVTGIERVTLTSGFGHPESTPMFFRIDMRSSKDLKVLALPSWWSFTHLMEVFGVVCVLSMFVTAWALLLRRRVTKQTEKIKQSMKLEKERSRLLEAISSEASLESLLEDISTSFEAFLPGMRCRVEASREAPEHPYPASLHEQFKLSAETVHLRVTLDDGRGNVLGHFEAQRTDGAALSGEELDVLEGAAELAALTISQRRMYDELNYSSSHDQLTGLMNRRVVDARLERALVECTAKGTMVAVAYIDVNDFKPINDTHGHESGDQYLQLIGSRLAGIARSSDVVARIGGDEFLMVFTGLPSAEFTEILRKRVTQCFDEPFVLDAVTIHGTASIGMAVSHDQGTLAEDLKRRADVDMYEAKSKHHKKTGTSRGKPIGPAEVQASEEPALLEPQFS